MILSSITPESGAYYFLFCFGSFLIIASVYLILTCVSLVMVSFHSCLSITYTSKIEDALISDSQNNKRELYGCSFRPW